MLVKPFALILVCFTITVLTDDSCKNWIHHKNFHLVHSGGSCGQVKIKYPDHTMTAKILNGVTVTPGSLPWMAYIETVTYGPKNLGGSRWFFCGGTVINKNYILTAAHCQVQATKLSRVKLGLHNRECVRKGCEPHTETYHVTKYIEHPEYDSKSSTNDIALLRLDRSISFESPYINYICLPTSCQLAKKDHLGEDLTMAGWGFFSKTRLATILQKVALPVRECEEYSNEDVTYSLVSSLLCTGSADVMACSGDSGGPLMYNATDRTVLVGLLSFGEPGACTWGEHFLRNAFTRISSFMPWILDNIEP